MKKILVIEDDFDVRENIVELLKSENFEVLVADNGRIGVEAAREHLPDVIICDMAMPELNGIAVLKLLKISNATLRIPFIFLTANADRNKVMEGISGGAVDYLVKPFNAERLLSAINRVLK